jgi:hypothetical protein
MSRHNPLRSQGPQRYLWQVAGALLLLLLSISIAHADQPPTGTLTGKILGQQVTFATIHGPAESHWAGSIGLQLDRDAPGDERGALVPVFCIQANVSTALGNRYVADGQVVRLPNGCQMRYLLAQYPADTARTAAEAAARQLALWHFSDAIDLTTIRQDAIRVRALVLAAEADRDIALHGCPGMLPLASEFTLEPRAATLPAGQSATYTVRVSPPAAASSVNVVITGAAALADGRQEASLPLSQGTATFVIRSIAPGTASIAARLPGQLDAGTVFSSANQQRPAQRLVLGAPAALVREAALTSVQGPADTPTASPTSTSVPSLTPTPPASPIASPTGTPTPAIPPTRTPAETPRPSSPPAAETPPIPRRHTATATPPSEQIVTPAVPSTVAGPTPGLAETPAAMPVAEVPRPASLPRTAGAAGDIRPALLTFAAILLGGGLSLVRRSAAPLGDRR